MARLLPLLVLIAAALIGCVWFLPPATYVPVLSFLVVATLIAVVVGRRLPRKK